MQGYVGVRLALLLCNLLLQSCLHYTLCFVLSMLSRLAGKLQSNLLVIKVHQGAGLLSDMPVADLLNSADELATVFAPTDGGIVKAAGAANITLDSLLSQPELITDIISYHVLPSQLAVSLHQLRYS